ncbi:MAG: hypothetical protein WC376_05085 [Candidatus Nanoarchaeia archaeon]|jgi:hypothetical protein
MPKAKKDKIENQLGQMSEITKNEVVQENNFYKAIKKYEGKESFNPWPVIIILIAIILAIIILL